MQKTKEIRLKALKSYSDEEVSKRVMRLYKERFREMVMKYLVYKLSIFDKSDKKDNFFFSGGFAMTFYGSKRKNKDIDYMYKGKPEKAKEDITKFLDKELDSGMFYSVGVERTKHGRIVGKVVVDKTFIEEFYESMVKGNLLWDELTEKVRNELGEGAVKRIKEEIIETPHSFELEGVPVKNDYDVIEYEFYLTTIYILSPLELASLKISGLIETLGKGANSNEFESILFERMAKDIFDIRYLLNNYIKENDITPELILKHLSESPREEKIKELVSNGPVEETIREVYERKKEKIVETTLEILTDSGIIITAQLQESIIEAYDNIVDMIIRKMTEVRKFVKEN